MFCFIYNFKLQLYSYVAVYIAMIEVWICFKGLREMCCAC